ncbi:MAG: O-antigen polymerase [Halomonadaceae bacterium T82-2]|nr:MAG: O-antigen polymerase [Halomonadaceae bacterium T82-2]
MGACPGWEAPTAWRCPRGLWIAGCLSLVLYAALGVLWSDVGGDAGTLTAALGLIAVLTYGGEMRRSAALWLLLAVIVVQVLSWTLGYFHHPQWVTRNPEVDRLAKLFIFIAVAWWLGGSTRNTLRLWALALAGFLVATLVLGGPQEWWQGLHGQRIGFGIRNNQHGSMLFGVALLGWVIFARRVMRPREVWVAWRVGLWGLVLAMCLTGIAIGQTRAVWLALAVSLPLAGLAALVVVRRYGAGRSLRRPLLLTLGAGVLLVTLAVALFGDTLAERVTTESGVIAQLMQGNLEQVPYTSIGIRIHSWMAALQWIAERPLVGWGGEGRSLVIDHTPWLPDFVKADFGHLHNFFIEVWVAYGLLGVAVIAALAAWIGRGTWLAWRGSAMPGDVALFGAAFFVYWVIVNQFESYDSFWTGVYVHNLVVGGLVTHYWRWRYGSRGA